MLRVKHRGDFSHFEQFANRVLRRGYLNILAKYGVKGVEALKTATPKDTGVTSESWNFEIEKNSSQVILRFINTNVNQGVNIAVILQYGHGTSQGAWIQGREYINDALKPVFDAIARESWKEVVMY